MYILHKDKKKYSRMEELLYMNDELKKARKAFEADELEKVQPNNENNEI